SVHRIECAESPTGGARPTGHVAAPPPVARCPTARLCAERRCPNSISQLRFTQFPIAGKACAPVALEGEREEMGRTLATLVLLCFGIVMVGSQPVRTDPQDALRFFRNYFVTGDYVVGGVGLRTIDGTADDQDGLADGFATRTIHVSEVNGNGVPADANILAAFLYWQTVVTTNQGSATDGAQF